LIFILLKLFFKKKKTNIKLKINEKKGNEKSFEKESLKE
jgi:hypothetical protein